MGGKGRCVVQEKNQCKSEMKGTQNGRKIHGNNTHAAYFIKVEGDDKDRAI